MPTTAARPDTLHSSVPSAASRPACLVFRPAALGLPTAARPAFLLSGLAAVGLVAAGPPPLILSEVLADPAAMADAEGEFLELGHPGGDSTVLENVVVEADGRSLALGPLSLGPSDCYLICRDSAAWARAGASCRRSWPSLSLANGRPLEISAAWDEGSFRVTVPASRAGESMENTWDPAAAYAIFLLSQGGREGDAATPGGRNSRSVLPPLRDLAVASVRVEGDRVRVGIEDRGREAPLGARLRLGLDADWDGAIDFPIDSLEIPAGRTFPAEYGFGLSGWEAGCLAAELENDDQAGNNRAEAAFEPGGRPLSFGAWDAAPPPGGAEWIEILNTADDRRGPGRAISLARASVGGMPLGPAAGKGNDALGSGERLFLTDDTAAFRARFGALKARILRPAPWRPLRNTGDTLRLVLGGIPLDTLAWGPEAAAGSGVRSDTGSAAEGPAWTLSGRRAAPDSPLEVEVRSPPGCGYVLRAFDLEGNRVRELGRGGPGRRAHAWDGRGDGGRRLPLGPFVLGLSFSNGAVRRRAVLAGEP